MTAITWPNDREGIESIVDSMLVYSCQKGIHLFQPRGKNKSISIIGDQGIITLVFSYCGHISHIELPRWFWNISLVRWFLVLWLMK